MVFRLTLTESFDPLSTRLEFDQVAFRVAQVAARPSAPQK
jgi:hypothetical protein